MSYICINKPYKYLLLGDSKRHIVSHRERFVSSSEIYIFEHIYKVNKKKVDFKFANLVSSTCKMCKNWNIQRKCNEVLCSWDS